VYVTQAYPGMKPYLKGFHLSLESWREGRNSEGWKVRANEVVAEAGVESTVEQGSSDWEAMKWNLMVQSEAKVESEERSRGPRSG
jgi:hypothetical protein